MANEARDRGRQRINELWGNADRLWENFAKFDEGFAHLMLDNLFGEVWSRPDLELKIRSFVTMSALLVLARWPQLKTHMRGALNIGITPEQLKGMIIHLSQYGGVPVAVEAIGVFREVMEERENKA